MKIVISLVTNELFVWIALIAIPTIALVLLVILDTEEENEQKTKGSKYDYF